MIRVPNNWACASHSCACVRLGDKVFLCRVVTEHGGLGASYTLKTVFALDADAARRRMSQDFTPWVEHRIEWRGEVKAGTRCFLPSPHGSVVLAVSCPLYPCEAKTLTLTGPRLDTRATPVQLSALLIGTCVAVGAAVQTADGVYEATAVDVLGGHGAIAFIGARCRMQLNDRRRRCSHPPSSASDACVSLSGQLVGLDEEIATLTAVIRMAAASSAQNSCVKTGMMVRGPRGCGVRSLVRQCLASAATEVDCLTWTPTFSAFTVAKSFTRSRGVLVLLVDPAEAYFAAEEPEVAALTLRKLMADMTRLSVHSTSVVIVAVSTDYSQTCAGEAMSALFTTHIVLSLPDASMRAALLASCRGTTAEECAAEALTLVGKTAAEVLEVGHGACHGAIPLSRPVQWSDIGGLDDVKDRLRRALVWPQRQPEVFARFGLSPPRGILLYGPPGCAKTTLVKALCSEGLFSLIYLDSATVMSAFVGESEQMLRDVFAKASQQSPCIVFFDEVEVLGARRSHGEHDASQARLLSTLLTEMDGFAAIKDVCFIGATNVPHLIDPALLRPGRFDYLVHVPLPNTQDRAEILSLLLKDTAADVQELAMYTEGFSGADLNALCSQALLKVFGDATGVPDCLQNRDWMKKYMEDNIDGFSRAVYDSAGLEEFQREHASAL